MPDAEAAISSTLPLSCLNPHLRVGGVRLGGEVPARLQGEMHRRRALAQTPWERSSPHQWAQRCLTVNRRDIVHIAINTHTQNNTYSCCIRWWQVFLFRSILVFVVLAAIQEAAFLIHSSRELRPDDWKMLSRLPLPTDLPTRVSAHGGPRRPTGSPGPAHGCPVLQKWGGTGSGGPQSLNGYLPGS